MATPGLQAGSAWISISPSLRGFHRKIRQDLQRELQGLSAEVPVRADTSEARREVERLQAEIRQLRGAEIDVDADTGAARARLKELQSRLRQLSGESATVQADADTGAATAQLAVVDHQVDRLDGRRANVTVDVDRAGTAQRGLFFLSNQVNGLLLAGAAIAPVMVPAFGAAAAAAGALAASVTAAGVGVAGLVAAAVPAFTAVTEVVKAQEQAEKSAATTAVQSSMQRVQAAFAAQQAAQQVADAQRSADRTSEDGARRVAQARENVARAQERAADTIVQAERRVADSEVALSRAQEDQQRAQEDLTQARQDALRTLEDMQERVSDLARSEQSAEIALIEAQQRLTESQGADGANEVEAAQLSLLDARERLAQVSKDGTATELDRRRALLDVSQAEEALAQAQRDAAGLALDRRKAALDVAEAEDRLSDTKRDQERATKDLAEAERNGVEGSDRVVSAQQRLEDAVRSVARATRDSEDAQAELARAQVEAARTVADAESELSLAREQAAQANADAARAVSDALAAQAQQAQLAAMQTAAGTAAIQNLAFAMGQLTPMQRELLAGWLSLREAFTGWSRELEPDVIPVFLQGMALLERTLPLLTPIVKATAAAFGVLLTQAGKALESPFWQQFFGFLAREAGPSTLMFGRVLGNLAKGFAGLIMAFGPFAREFGAGLVNLTERFANWGAGLGDNAGFRGFIDYIKAQWPQLKATLAALWAAFQNIVTALAPLAGPVLVALEAVFSVIGSMPPGLLAAIAGGLLSIGVAFKAVGVAMAVLNANPLIIIIAAVTALGVWLVRTYQTSETFRAIVHAVFETIGRVATTAFGAMISAGQAVWNWLSQNWPTLLIILTGPIGAAVLLIVRHWDTIVGGVKSALGWVRDNWPLLLQILTGPIGLAVVAIVRNWDTIKSGAKSVIEAVGGFFIGLGESIGKFFTESLPKSIISGVAAIVKWINKHMIGNLNKILGVFGVEIDTIPVPGQSRGGRGGGGGGGRRRISANAGGLVPGSGLDRDSVDAFLTPGEGIIRRSRMREIAASMGTSPKMAIDAINNTGVDPSARGGAFDFIGDIAHGISSGISSIGSQIGSWLKQGAAFALDKVMTPIVTGVPHVIPGPEFVQDYFRGVLDHAKDKIVAWGRGKDKESEGTIAGKAPGGVPDLKGGAFAFPLPRGSYRVGRGTAGHGYPAQDWPAPAGVPVFSPFAGRLVQRSMRGSYGNHSNVYAGNTRVILAHFSSHVGPSRSVSKGELIGRVGTTGNSTGNHLHGEVKVNGRGRDPRRFWKYDSGGSLPQGLSLAFNGTGERERILDPAETRAYERGGDTYQFQAFGTPAALVSEVTFAIETKRQARRPLIRR